jgi:hypothetical protein
MKLINYILFWFFKLILLIPFLIFLIIFMIHNNKKYKNQSDI